MPDVVVLLPGIMGSVLKRGEKVVWGHSPTVLGAALLTGGQNLRSTLALPGDDADQDDLGDGITAAGLMPDLHLLPGFWKIDGYSKVSRAIAARFDVTEGKNFFHFAYDWRRDNRVAARRLARTAHEWLARWRTESGNTEAQLILVAHSMGGLVSRYFLEVLEGWKTTRALVTFGTPYRGSLNALDTLANGIRKGPLGLVDLTAVARQFTSIYQLLPIYPCYDRGAGRLRRVGESEDIPHVDSVKAAEALAFHREIELAVDQNRRDQAYRDHGYTIHPVVGIGQQTYQSARAKPGGVEMLRTLNDRNLRGDGTVPRVSALPIELGNAPAATYVATQHGSIQNAEAVLVHLEGVLSGAVLALSALRGQPQIAIDVEDIYWSTEQVTIRARSTTPGGDLSAVVYSSERRKPFARLAMSDPTNGWQAAMLPPVEPGGYSVEVGGDGVQAEDSFLVAPSP